MGYWVSVKTLILSIILTLMSTPIYIYDTLLSTLSRQTIDIKVESTILESTLIEVDHFGVDKIRVVDTLNHIMVIKIPYDGQCNNKL